MTATRTECSTSHLRCCWRQSSGRSPGVHVIVRFASEDTDPLLRDGFAVLSDALGGQDETATEVFWGALHGLSLLERSGRMRPEHREHRIGELAARFAATHPGD